jgi:L-asparagine transporter-like permease
MVLGMSSEATAVSILVQAWLPRLPISVLGSVIIVMVTLLNLLGADRFSKLESGLAAIKVFTILSFMVVAVLLIIGVFPGRPAVGLGELAREPFAPGGILGLAGSMLIVMFSYAGFEIIGLAASEAHDPQATIPRAIRQTVTILVGLFIVYIFLLLPLIPTAAVNETTSPIVAALERHGFGWATAINLVLITAILSTMLASMFGLGRMMRSLADEGHAPAFLKDTTNVPYRGILFSGFGMLLALGLGLLFPRVYLFLISSGGFATLFSYAMIMATHIRFRRQNGCPPNGQCQMWGFPYTSIFVLISLIVAIFSMPFVAGQTSGLIAGIIVVVFFSLVYYFAYYRRRGALPGFSKRRGLPAEFSEELTDPKEKKDAITDEIMEIEDDEN